MKKIFVACILGIFFLNNVGLIFASEDFEIETSISQNKQKKYKKAIDNIFDNYYKDKLSNKPNEDQVDTLESISGKIDNVLEKDMSDLHRFIFMYLNYIIENKVGIINIQMNIQNTTNSNNTTTNNISTNESNQIQSGNQTNNSNNTTIINNIDNSKHTTITDNSNNSVNIDNSKKVDNSNNSTNTNIDNSKNTNNTIIDNSKNTNIQCGNGSHIENGACMNNKKYETCINKPVNSKWIKPTGINVVTGQFVSEWDSGIYKPLKNDCDWECNIGYEEKNNTCVKAISLDCTNPLGGTISNNTSAKVGTIDKGENNGIFTYEVFKTCKSGTLTNEELKNRTLKSCDSGYKAENSTCVKIPLDCNNPLGGTIKHNSSGKVGSIDKTENNGVFTYEVFKTCNDGTFTNEELKNKNLKICDSGYKAENGGCVRVINQQWRDISGTSCTNDDYVFTLEGKTYTWAGCNSVLGTTGVQGDYDGECENYGMNSLELNRSACYGYTEKEINYSSNVGENNIWGKLYSWDNANRPNNACPTGWHLPSDNEFLKLETFLNGGPNTSFALVDRDSDGNIRGYLFGGLGWGKKFDGSARNNIVKALKLPLAGSREDYTYYGRGSFGFLWTSTKYDSSNAYFRRVSYSDSYINRNYNPINQGYSVRCVKD